MAKRRLDNWSFDQDELLAKIVLRNIRIGKTQLTGFEEAAARLDRTFSACGFRWNSEVRKQYAQEIKIAKKERPIKNGKANISSQVLDDTLDTSSKNFNSHMDTIITLANHSKIKIDNLTKQIQSMTKELENRDIIINELKNELEQNKIKPNEFTIGEDYKHLLKILKHARENGVLSDVSFDEKKSIFKMDSNGNLEKII